MPKFSASEREKIYALLIQKGEELFNENGFYTVTAEQIALSAGIAKGTFYHFFENKEHLYMTVNNGLQAKIFSGLQTLIEKPENVPMAEKFYQLLCYVMEAFMEHPLIINLDAQVWSRIESKAPKACLYENEERDLKLVSLLEQSGFSFRYDLERTMALLQMQFLQLATIKKETQRLDLMKILLKALSEHLIKEDTQ